MVDELLPSKLLPLIFKERKFVLVSNRGDEVFIDLLPTLDFETADVSQLRDLLALEVVFR